MSAGVGLVNYVHQGTMEGGQLRYISLDIYVYMLGLSS